MITSYIATNVLVIIIQLHHKLCFSVYVFETVAYYFVNFFVCRLLVCLQFCLVVSEWMRRQLLGRYSEMEAVRYARTQKGVTKQITR